MSDEAAALLDEHVRDHGRVLATAYDLTASTLNEVPDVLLVARVQVALKYTGLAAVADHDPVSGTACIGLHRPSSGD